jgi:hypothetical protein
LISGLAFFIGLQLFPAMPAGQVAIHAALGLAGGVALMTVVALLYLAVGHFILRRGGTDTQWFWFPGSPKGLARLRGDAGLAAADSAAAPQSNFEKSG